MEFVLGHSLGLWQAGSAGGPIDGCVPYTTSLGADRSCVPRPHDGPDGLIGQSAPSNRVPSINTVKKGREVIQGVTLSKKEGFGKYKEAPFLNLNLGKEVDGFVKPRDKNGKLASTPFDQGGHQISAAGCS
jgi:hypothetical protein